MTKRKILLSGTVLLATVLLVPIFIPGSILFLLNLGLDRYGLQLQTVGELAIGRDRLRLTMAKVTFIDSDTKVELADGVLHFTVFPLKWGDLKAAKLVVEIPARASRQRDSSLTDAPADSLSLGGLVNQFWLLPFNSVVIDQLHIVSGEQEPIAVSRLSVDKLVGGVRLLQLVYHGRGVRAQLKKSTAGLLELTVVSDNHQPIRIEAVLQPRADDFEVKVKAHFPITALQQLDILADKLGAWDGLATLEFSSHLADDLNSALELSYPLQINHLQLHATASRYPLSLEHDTDIQLDLSITEPLNLLLEPTGDIHSVTEHKTLSVRLSTEQRLLQAGVEIGALHCSSQIQFSCRASWSAMATAAEATIDVVQLNDWGLQLRGNLSVGPQGLSLGIDAGGFIRGAKLAGAGLDMRNTNLALSAPLQIDYHFATKNIQLQSTDMQLQLPELYWGGTPYASIVRLTELQLVSSPSLQLSLGLQLEPLGTHSGWPLPIAIQAEIEVSGGNAIITGHINSNREVPLLTIEGEHAFSSGFGEARLHWVVPALVTSNPLSSWFEGWPYAWDIYSGEINMAAAATWQQNGDVLTLHAQSSGEVGKLAGAYREAVFTGANATYSLRAVDFGAIETARPACISVDFLDVGLPLTELKSCLQLGAGLLSLEQLNFNVLGGVVALEPQRYNITDPAQQATLLLSGLHIEKILALASYPDVEASGLLSGHLPLSISEEGIAMEAGTVSALAPGGIIRYSPASSRDLAASNPALQLVNDALANYHFDSLLANARYSLQGDLDFAIAMKGANPDLNSGQKINLNLTISDNIPLLLTSLQSGRTIAELLQQHLPRD